jgi:hypothetical protein
MTLASAPPGCVERIGDGGFEAESASLRPRLIVGGGVQGVPRSSFDQRLELGVHARALLDGREASVRVPVSDARTCKQCLARPEKDNGSRRIASPLIHGPGKPLHGGTSQPPGSQSLPERNNVPKCLDGVFVPAEVKQCVREVSKADRFIQGVATLAR